MKFDPKLRTKRTVEVWDICTCGEVLHSMAEGERGTCSSCWFNAMDPAKKKAMNNLVASAFNGSTDAEKDAAIDEAFRHLSPTEGSAEEKS